MKLGSAAPDMSLIQFKRVRVFCGVALSVLTLPASSWLRPNVNGPDAGRFQEFARDLDDVRNSLEVPGMAAAIVENGHVAWQQNYGFADLERKLPVRADTEFCIASLSKTMAAVILMQLEQQGLLQLDDPIDKYLPNTSIPRNITIRQLMSHTSDGQPGEEFLYNGARYAVLSQIVEKLTGKPYAAALSERVLNPLGMKHTIPGLSAPGFEALEQKLAKPYRWDGDSDRIRLGELPDPGVSAANGVVSDLNDLAQYAIALDDHALVSKPRERAMFAPTRSSRGENLPYGLGWFVQDYIGQKLVWHFGQEESYASLFLRVPERKLTLVVLANSNSISDAFRLLDGNAARSLLVLDFIRDLVLRDEPSSETAQRQLDADRNLDQALASIYLHQPEQAVQFTKAAFRNGALHRNPDVPTLYLLMRLHDPDLNTATEIIGASLLREHPNLPTALFYFGSFYEQTDRPEKAMIFFQRIADINPPLHHWTASLALLELGKWYATRDRAQARKYLRRVVEMNLNVENAVDQAQQILRGIPQSSAGAGIRNSKRPEIRESIRSSSQACASACP